MTYDVPLRHQQALDPSSLTTIAATFHALGKGIEDCRNAGVDPEHDPAIVLLVRHFARIMAFRADDDSLRALCRHRIGELDRFPALLSLALHGVNNDRVAKERFHADGRTAMRGLARALGLPEGSYRVTSFHGDPAISGAVVLSTCDLEVSLSVGPLHEGNEVQYFAKRGPAARDRLRFASMREFVKTARFAARIRRELQLGATRQSHALAAAAQVPAIPEPVAA